MPLVLSAFQRQVKTGQEGEAIAQPDPNADGHRLQAVLLFTNPLIQISNRISTLLFPGKKIS
jgi:hypothetical protein